MRLAHLALLALALAAPAARAAAEEAGRFDFYVLSLSWSPSYCEAEGEDDGLQCGGRRPFAFVLHGLWPQYDRGFPDFCEGGPERGPSRREVDSLLDIAPSPGLVRHQWRKHGSCSGLSAGEFLDLMRKGFDRVAIPARFKGPDRPARVSPSAVEDAFIAANRGLEADGIAVTCDDRRLREVRICLTRDDLEFRACPEIDRRGCRRGDVAMPPVR